MTLAILPWLLSDRYSLPLPQAIIFSVLGLLLGVGFPAIILRLAYGRRMEIDETGVRLYSFSRLKRSLLWKEIRSCGISRLHAGRAPLVFYVSTDPETVEYKSPKSMISFNLNPQGAQAVRDEELILYCRASMIAHRFERS